MSVYGAAALHPSMKALDETAITEPRVRMSRLVLLASSTLIAPSIIIIEALRGTISRVAGSIAVFAALHVHIGHTQDVYPHSRARCQGCGNRDGTE
jgi:hypothetical protein